MMTPRDPLAAALYLAARAVETTARAVADALAEPPPCQRLEILVDDVTQIQPETGPVLRRVGQRLTLAVFGKTSDGFPAPLPGPVEWKCSNPDALRFDSKGDGVGAARLTAVAPGEATITAHSVDLTGSIGARVEFGPAESLEILAINNPDDLLPPSPDGGPPVMEAGSWAWAATPAQLAFLAKR